MITNPILEQGKAMTTAPQSYCRYCGLPEHGNLSCEKAGGYPVVTSLAEAPRKRVNVSRNSRGWTVEATVEVFSGETDDEIMAMVESLIAKLEAKYPRE